MSKSKVDLFRDTPIRYLGYANEIGEAFRNYIGNRMVLGTYGIATLYVLADTYDKTTKCYKQNSALSNRIGKTIYTGTDTLVWQMLASVIIPGFTINRLCAFTSYLLKSNNQLPKQTKKLIVTTIGLVAIPFIIKPIDRFTDRLLDVTIRKVAP